jgi:hypothetical protein
VNAESLRTLFDLAGASFHITHVTGQGGADRSLTRVRGSIVLHARMNTPPRVPFRVRFLYRGTRTPGERTPGRVPLIPTS